MVTLASDSLPEQKGLVHYRYEGWYLLPYRHQPCPQKGLEVHCRTESQSVQGDPFSFATSLKVFTQILSIVAAHFQSHTSSDFSCLNDWLELLKSTASLTNLLQLVGLCYQISLLWFQHILQSLSGKLCTLWGPKYIFARTDSSPQRNLLLNSDWVHRHHSVHVSSF